MTGIELPQNDPDRFAIVRRHLHTAVLGDVLDSLGEYHRFLAPDLRPVLPQLRLVGRAMPVRIVEVTGEQAQPFGRLTEALDALQPGEVYLAQGRDVDCASWGELMTTAVKARGAAGAVIDGYHRDTEKLLGLGLPVYSRGGYGQDARVRSAVVDYRVALRFGEVDVEPGDLVVADRDGVVVVQRAIETDVLRRALAKVATEDVVRTRIIGGLSTTEAFATYGVL